MKKKNCPEMMVLNGTTDLQLSLWNEKAKKQISVGIRGFICAFYMENGNQNLFTPQLHFLSYFKTWITIILSTNTSLWDLCFDTHISIHIKLKYKRNCMKTLIMLIFISVKDMYCRLLHCFYSAVCWLPFG